MNDQKKTQEGDEKAPVKIILGIAERLNFPSLLPVNADFLTLSIKNDIVEKIQITQKETELLELTGTPSEGGRVNFNWKKELEFDKEFEFTKLEEELICKELKDKDTTRQLTDQLLTIYRKFIKVN